MAEEVEEMFSRGWQGQERGGGWAVAEAFPVYKDGKVHFIRKELPVLWLWQRARCLPSLVHFKIHCLAFNSLPDPLLEVLMTDCSQNNTQSSFFQL